MKDPKWRLEDLNTFQEEWPFFLKKDGESLIRCDNGCICFDLGEIRIVSRIECNIRREGIFDRHADILLERVVYPTVPKQRIRIAASRTINLGSTTRLASSNTGYDLKG